jgi:hypothetical protein
MPSLDSNLNININILACAIVTYGEFHPEQEGFPPRLDNISTRRFAKNDGLLT